MRLCIFHSSLFLKYNNVSLFLCLSDNGGDCSLCENGGDFSSCEYGWDCISCENCEVLLSGKMVGIVPHDLYCQVPTIHSVKVAVKVYVKIYSKLWMLQ